jgi:HSP20 family protein
MAIRYLNPADIFRQMEMEMFRQNDPSIGAVFFQPCVDMYETDQALVIKMELAGVRPSKLQIELSADDRLLTISGERIEGSEEHRDRIRCHHLEIYFGEFQREISLPNSVPFDRDDISAKYRDGFLVVSLPKREAKTTEKRTIEITGEARAGERKLHKVKSALKEKDSDS